MNQKTEFADDTNTLGTTENEKLAYLLGGHGGGPWVAYLIISITRIKSSPAFPHSGWQVVYWG